MIVLNVSTLRVNEESKRVTGQIWWEVEGACFPDEDWWDNPIILLDWWLNALVSVVHLGEETCQFSFMEGPYWIVCQREGGALHCDFIDRRLDSESALFTAKLPIQDIASQLKSTVAEATTALSSYKCLDQQLEGLHQGTEML